MIYKIIINGTAANCNSKISTKETTSKIYRILFLLQSNDVNLNEKRGILETNRKQEIITSISRNSGCKNRLQRKSPTTFSGLIPETKAKIEKIKIAFAGVGSPRKLLTCFSSILNFANLQAENTGIKNPKNAT